MLETDKREQLFWDERAAATAPRVRYYGDLTNTPDRKIMALHRYALSLLGNVEGKKILDCGCGYGALSCHLAKRGARMTAIDVSPRSLAVAEEWFRRNQVIHLIDRRVVSLHDVSFEDESFDFIIGSCILHHLDLEEAMPKLRRLLKKDGRAVFVENNGSNPLLMFVRNKILAPLGMRRGSPDESPIDAGKFAIIRRHFPDARRHFPEMIFFRFVASFFFKDFGPLRRALERFDSVFARLLPFTSAWSYFGVIEMKKDVSR